MSNQIHELSSSDLEEVSGGLRIFPAQTDLPNAPVVPPPVLGPRPGRSPRTRPILCQRPRRLRTLAAQVSTSEPTTALAAGRLAAFALN
jgi:hypothetical protein